MKSGTSFFSVLRARTGAELEKPGQRALFRAWNLALFLLSSVGITGLSLLLGLGYSHIGVFYGYFQAPLLFLLNWIPVLLLQLLLYALFNRQWPAFLTTALIILAASAADFYKLKIRSEPVTFEDIQAIGAALGVAGGYDLTPTPRVWLTIAAVPLGTLVLALLARGRLRRRGRLAMALAVLLSLAPLWRFIYADHDFYTNVAVSKSLLASENWTQHVYVSKGFVYPFIHSIAESSYTKPDGYDAAAAAALLTPEDADIPADRRVNIIAVQLESFADLRDMGLEGIDPECYRQYDEMLAESLSGTLLVNVLSGGTINTERCVLTGAYTQGNYFAKTYSHVWYLRSQGYVAVGSHPNSGSFYSRQAVNERLGFQQYWFLDNHYEPLVADLPHYWFSDSVFFPELLAEYRSRVAAGESVFSFNVGMQGHGPYNANKLRIDKVFWPNENCSEETYNIVNNYLGSINETQFYLSAMLDELRDDPAPVVVLTYGDHKPALGDLNSACGELGINVDAGTEEGFLNAYSTRYVLWANEAARELLGGEVRGEGPTVSPGFLMNVVFDTLGWEGSSMIQLERKTMQELTAVTTNDWYVAGGKLTRTLTDEQEQLRRELEWAQYYANYSFAKLADRYVPKETVS